MEKETQEQTPKALIFIEENGEVKFILQGISIDEAFLLAKKGYIKVERLFSGSV